MDRYVVEESELDKLIELLNRLLNVRIAFLHIPGYDPDQYHFVPITDFCTEWRKDPEHLKMCSACDEFHKQQAMKMKELHTYRCHNGLIENILPLYNVKGKFLGAIIFGQFRDQNSAPSRDLSEKLQEYYEQIPVTDMDKVSDIGALLKYVGETIINRELIRYQNKAWTDKLDDYIENHLHEKITVDDLAEAIERSPSFVARHFKEEFSQTPHQYILKRRMEEAKIMLENGMPVQDVAERLGFYDSFHFSRTFKKEWGEPPSNFRSE